MKTNYIALSTPFFFILIMLELVLARWQGKRYYRFNDAITAVGCGIGQQITGVLVKGLLFTGYVYMHEHYAITKLSYDSPLAWVLAFFGVDLAYYWWHRLSHEVNFLWAIHVVHHQSEDYNLAVALRQAWFSGLSIWPFYLPIVLLGVDPLLLVTMSAISTLYQFWIHTRTIKRLGLLEEVINTPALHRVHHARNYDYLDKNYGAILIIWDRIFGSYMQEQDEPLYGTVKPYGSWNPIYANFAYWLDLWRDAAKAPYFIDKLKIWFKFPGWLPRGVVKNYSAQAQPQEAIRYNTNTPMGLNLYIGAQFIFVVLITTYVMVAHPTVNMETVVAVLFVLFTTLIWSGLFEKRSWAIPCELLRLTMAAAFVVVKNWPPQSSSPISLPLSAITIAALIGMAIWILQYRKRSESQSEMVAA